MSPVPGPEPAGIVQLQELFRHFISIFVGGAFVALVIMLTIGGIKFLTSGGDANALKSATQTVVWALLGMLFLVIAWLVLQLIGAFTGVNLLDFNIGILCPGEVVTGCLP